MKAGKKRSVEKKEPAITATVHLLVDAADSGK